MIIDKVFGKHSAKIRITIGLISIIVSLILVSVLLGIFPNETTIERKARQALTETIATKSSIFITQADFYRMKTTLQVIVARNENMLSAAVFRDSQLISEIGEHTKNWLLNDKANISDEQILIPLWSGELKWGRVEIRFKPIIAPGLLGFITTKLSLFIIFLSASSFILYFFYLGKVLKHLDPSQAVPDHVRSALDTMAEGLLVLDKNQSIVLANEAFSTIVDQPRKDIVGRVVSSFSWEGKHGELLTTSTPWQSAIDSGQVLINEVLRLMIPGKGKRTFMVNCSPVLLPGGKVGGVLVSFDDVTLLEEKEIELRRSKEEAEAANRAKSDFLANMSHEIRTPMNAILGFTDMLRRDRKSLQPGQEQHLNTISSSGSHLLNLINDILDLSKVEAGHLDVEIVDYNPVLLIREVLQIMKVKADEKALGLFFEGHAALPQSIKTDPGRVRQILTNMIGNAIKFTDHGSVTVTPYIEKIAPYRLLIDVTDTGIGMTEQQAQSVFEAFVQADSSITRRFGGTGLGLSISKQFADALGGGLSVKSLPNIGTTFTLSLKLESDDTSLWSVPEAIQLINLEDDVLESIEWTFPKAHVLVVDDGTENRELIKLILDDLQVQSTSAINGRDALEKATKTRFDVILMDVQMPIMDGYTAVGKMRLKGIKQPIVALTAHAMKGIEIQCLKAGYSHYMTKPINIDALITLLAELLNAQHTQLKASTDSVGTAIIDVSIEKTDNILQPIISTLPVDNPKFAHLVKLFINKLNDRMPLMEQSFKDNNYSDLADHAHWLKGSGGSVGLMVFTELAIPFEEAANTEQSDLIAAQLNDIKLHLKRAQLGLAKTLQILPRNDVNLVLCNDRQLLSAPMVEHRVNEEASLQATQKETGTTAIEASTNQRISVVVNKYLINENASKKVPLRSTLIKKNMKFKPLVEQFCDKLPIQVTKMQTALLQHDFSELADLSHWLKGSAGSIGFTQFTDIAAELEHQAHQENTINARALLSIIERMCDRIDRH